jgi:hypothetical protein
MGAACVRALLARACWPPSANKHRSMSAMERNALGPLLADDCLWGLAPQSSPWPKSAVYPSAAFGEDGESRLPATSGHSRATS